MSTSKGIKFHLIRNPLRSEIRETWIEEYQEGRSLSDYLKGITILRGVKLVAAIDGYVIKDSWDNVFPKEGSIVAVSAEVEGPIAAAVATWAVTITGAASTAALGVISGYSVAAMLVYGATYIATSLVIGLGINLIASAIFAPDTPSFNRQTQEESNTYGWGPLKPSEGEGFPIPIVFGTHKVGGHVINKFTEVNGDKEHLNVLIALCDHSVEDITDIRINEQPYNNFKNVHAYTRHGHLDDSPISQFGEIVQQRSPQILLSHGSDARLETDGNSVEKLTIVLGAPYGMYKLNESNGDKEELSATINIQYREQGGNWIDYRHITIRDSVTTAIRRSVVIDNLPPNKYEVRVMRTSPDHDDFRKESRVYFDSFKEAIDEKLSYPGIAKYGIKALATDQLSGGMPSFSCIVKRNHVVVRDKNGNPTEVDVRNPAWAAYALLNVHHNIHHSRLIWDEFVEWAVHCDSLIPEGETPSFSIVLDNQSNVWKNVNRIASFGRGTVLRRGSRYGVFIDKPESGYAHVFTMGNIVSETFEMQYLPKKDRANAVEIAYVDPDRDYTNQVVFVYDDKFTNSDEVPKKSNIKFNACMSQRRAVEEAIYILNSNKGLVRTIEFEAAVDSFNCVVGDVVLFHHDVPNYHDSTSGRIESATYNSVTLDKEFYFKPGVSYSIIVRTQYDDIVERFISSDTYGKTNIVYITSSWNIGLEPYDIYIIGETSTIYKKYRITNITRAQDLTRRVTCIEYNDNIYNTEGGPGLWYPTDPPVQEATGVRLNEFLTYSKAGDYQSNLSVSWHPMNDTAGSNWDVWIEDITNLGITGSNNEFSDVDAVGEMQKVGSTTQCGMVISSSYLSLNHYYRVYVTPVNKGAIDTGSNTAIIQILGKLAPPNDVTNFSAVYNRSFRTISFTWDQVSNLDIDYYEIREGGSWENSTYVCNSIGGSDNIDVDESMEGSYTYWIKAVDTSKVKSVNATSAVVTVESGTHTDLPTPSGLTLESWTETVNGEVICILKAIWSSNAATHPDFRYFEIILTKNPNNPFSSRSNYTTEDSDYQWNDVDSGVQYGVNVRAVDVDGAPTNYCEMSIIITGVNLDPPEAPSWADIELIPGFKVIGAKWNAVDRSDITQYELQRSDTGVFEGEEVSVITFEGVHYTDTDLKADKEYWYRVRAISIAGVEGEWSSVVSATTLKVGSEDIAYRAVRAQHIDAVQLSALTADVGSLLAGKIMSLDFINSPAATYDPETGKITFNRDVDIEQFTGTYIDLDDNIIFMGNENAQSNNYLLYDGYTLHINGIINTWNAGDGTKIDGGAIYPGSHIQIGNEDGASDYAWLDQGELTFYRYFPDGKHKSVRSVRRIDFGTANHGKWTRLPGYWVCEPEIKVWLKKIPVYVSNFQNASQEIICDVADVHFDRNTGICKFVPSVYVQLVDSNYSPGMIYVNSALDEDNFVAECYCSYDLFNAYTNYGYVSTKTIGASPGYEKITVQFSLANHATSYHMNHDGQKVYYDVRRSFKICAVIDDSRSVTLFTDSLCGESRTIERSFSLDPRSAHDIKLVAKCVDYSDDAPLTNLKCPEEPEKYSIPSTFKWHGYTLEMAQEGGVYEIASGVVTWMAMELQGNSLNFPEPEPDTETTSTQITCQTYIPPTYLEYDFTSANYEAPTIDNITFDLCN